MYQLPSQHRSPSMKGGPWPVVIAGATAAVVVAAEVFRDWHPPGASPGHLDVEADVEHVAVFDDVGLALETLPAALHDLGTGARLDQITPADHLATDEPARDVRMDRRRRIERGLAATQRPGARLVLGSREERDQIDGLEEAPRDLADRSRRAFPERSGPDFRQLGQLGLELGVQAAGTVANLDQRLRRQRLEPRRQLPGPLGQRSFGLEVREYCLELVHLVPKPGVARLRLLPDAFESPLDVVAVGDQQLELQRHEIVSGIPGSGPGIQDCE